MTSGDPTNHAAELARKYDGASSAWGDKMRTLGYYDAYLGFLAEDGLRFSPGTRILDIGCGTGAFSEAWLAIQGPRQEVTLLDPSGGMLDNAASRLKRRGVKPDREQRFLDGFRPQQPFDVLLAAHVLEHSENPTGMLAEMRGLLPSGGRLWLVVSKPHWCNAIIWLQWRHRAYRPEGVQKMAVAAGWQIVREYAFPSGPPSRTSRGYLLQA